MADTTTSDSENVGNVIANITIDTQNAQSSLFNLQAAAAQADAAFSQSTGLAKWEGELASLSSQAEAFKQAMGDVGDVTSGLDAIFQDEVGSINKLADSFRVEQEEIASVAEALKDFIAQQEKIVQASEAKNGYGVSGGLVGPQEEQDSEAEDDGSGGGGGRFGGRGFGAAGGLARKLGAPGVGSALSAVGEITQTVNLISRITEAFAALEIPMAAVAAIVAAVAIPLAAIAAAFAVFQQSEKSADEALGALAHNIDELYKVLQSDSTQQATNALLKAQSDQARAQAEYDALQGALSQKFATEANGVLGDLGARIRTQFGDWFDQGSKDANKKLTDLNTQLIDTGGKVSEFSGALHDSALAAQDAVDKVTEANKLTVQFYDLVKSGSEQSIKDAIMKNSIDQANTQGLIDATRNAMNTTTDPAKVAELKVQLADYQQQLTGLQATYQNLTAALPDATQVQANIDGIKTEQAAKLEGQKLIETGDVKHTEMLIAQNNQQAKNDEDAIAQLKKLKDAADAKGDEGAAQRYQDTIDAYNADLDKLDIQFKELTTTTLPLAQATKIAQDSMKSFIDWLSGKGADSLPKLTEDFIKTSDKIGESQAKYDQETAKLTSDRQTADLRSKEDFDTKISRADEDHKTKQQEETTNLYAEVDKITATANNKQLQLKTDLTTKEAQIAIDLAAQIQDIQQKAHADELDAASSLDARKIAQIERTASDQETKATEAADKQKSKLETDTQTKIDDLQKSSEAERAQRLKDGLEKIKDEDDQYNISRQRQIDDNNLKQQREQEDRDKSDAARLSNFTNQQQVLKDHLDQLTKIQVGGSEDQQKAAAKGMAGVTTVVETVWNGLKTFLGMNPLPTPTATASPSIFGSGGLTPPSVFTPNYTAQQYINQQQQPTSQTISLSGSSGGSSSSSIFTPNSYANSYLHPNSHADGLGYVPHDNYFANLHKGEMVLTATQAEQQRSGANGQNITLQAGAVTINGTNMSQQQIEDALIKALRGALK